MATKQYLISDTEMEVMEVLWESDVPLKCSDLLRIFNERGKDWKRQTMNTFVTRLKNKGLVEVDQRIVKVLYNREEYQRRQAQEILNDMYEGRLQNFFAALSGIKEKDDTEDARELIELIERLAKDKEG